MVLRGGGEIEIGGERLPLDADHFVRVGPAETRKVVSGPEGIRMLALGGTPGQVYEAPDVAPSSAAPDPMATARPSGRSGRGSKPAHSSTGSRG